MLVCLFFSLVNGPRCCFLAENGYCVVYTSAICILLVFSHLPANFMVGSCACSCGILVRYIQFICILKRPTKRSMKIMKLATSSVHVHIPDSKTN